MRSARRVQYSAAADHLERPLGQALDWANRPATRLAARPRLILELLGVSALFASACVILGLAIFGAGHQHELFRDFGPASFATSAMTLAVATYGALIARAEARSHDWRDVNNFWFLSGLGFLYLTIDAPLDLHGHIGEGIARLAGHASVPGVHRMSDAVLLAYAALGLAVAAVHHREILPHRRAVALLGAGVFATMVMLAIDASGAPTPWMVVAEESVELAGASCFVAAYAHRFRATPAAGRSGHSRQRP